MKLKNKVPTRLHPVLALHGYCVTFEEGEGTYDCQLHVHQGAVQFTHRSFNQFSGGWDDPPIPGDEEQFVVREGQTRHIRFTNRIHDWSLDYIAIANNSYWKPAEFTFQYERSREV